MRGTDSKNGESRRNSLPRCPLEKEPLRRLTLGLFKQEIKLAARRICIHLLIPARLLTGTEPLHQALVFFGRQAADSGFDLLNAVHTGSLAARSEGATTRNARKRSTRALGKAGYVGPSGKKRGTHRLA